jgi:hypothetical protein
MSKQPKTPSGYYDRYGNPIPMENFDNDFEPGPVPDSMRRFYEQFRSRVIDNKPTSR